MEEKWTFLDFCTFVWKGSSGTTYVKTWKNAFCGCEIMYQKSIATSWSRNIVFTFLNGEWRQQYFCTDVWYGSPHPVCLKTCQNVFCGCESVWKKLYVPPDQETHFSHFVVLIVPSKNSRFLTKIYKSFVGRIFLTGKIYAVDRKV